MKEANKMQTLLPLSFRQTLILCLSSKKMPWRTVRVLVFPTFFLNPLINAHHVTCAERDVMSTGTLHFWLLILSCFIPADDLSCSHFNPFIPIIKAIYPKNNFLSCFHRLFILCIA